MPSTDQVAGPTARLSAVSAHWRDVVIYGVAGPQPQVLHEDAKAKVVVVGLEAGAAIPVHSGGAGVYHFVEGAGQMHVDGQHFDVAAGSIVIVPDGAARGVTATERLAFVAVRLH